MKEEYKKEYKKDVPLNLKEDMELVEKLINERKYKTAIETLENFLKLSICHQ